MRLLDLEPQLLTYRPRKGRVYHHKVKTIARAQGVRFLCPKCFCANGGKVGTHGVICWSRSRGVPDTATPGPGRWTLLGTGLHDLTLGPEPGKSHSVPLIGGCAWHGYVEGGAVRDA